VDAMLVAHAVELSLLKLKKLNRFSEYFYRRGGGSNMNYITATSEKSFMS
jgi:hypothetical protein